jgi:putative tryptophan/tyrosine transport system substrate-binding protein
MANTIAVSKSDHLSQRAGLQGLDLFFRPARTQEDCTKLLQQQAHDEIPIVFVGVSEPIEQGFVGSLARPGGNLTGFMLHEAAVAGKWLQILNEIAPTTARAGFIFDPRGVFWLHHLREIEATASSLGIKLVPSPVEHPADIQRVIEAVASEPNSGLVVSSAATASIHRNLIIALAALHRLPAVYPHRVFAADGGLMSYAADERAGLACLIWINVPISICC